MNLARIGVCIDSGTYCMYWYVLVCMACIGMYSKLQVLVCIDMYLYVWHVLVCMVCIVSTGMYLYFGMY